MKHRPEASLGMAFSFSATKLQHPTITREDHSKPIGCLELAERSLGECSEILEITGFLRFAGASPIAHFTTEDTTMETSSFLHELTIQAASSLGHSAAFCNIPYFSNMFVASFVHNIICDFFFVGRFRAPLWTMSCSWHWQRRLSVGFLDAGKHIPYLM